MSTLVFPTREALHLALTSRLVPPEVQAAPAHHHASAEGPLYVTPHAPLTKGALAELATFGVRVDAKAPRGESSVRCWAELLPTHRVPLDGVLPGTVMFLPTDADALLALAGELLRLGCDRQEVCFAKGEEGSRALLRAVAPPYFTLTGAIDRAGGLRAFVPAVPGQTSVWVELGHVHPLARTLQPAAGNVLLIPGEGAWLTAADGPWLDLYQLTDLRLPEPARAWEPLPAPGRLSVPLRLTRAARTEPASLWVLRENAVAQVESLVHTLPEPVLAQLRFAVTGPPDAPCIILRARAGRERPPELGLSAMAYAPLPQVAELYLPCDGLLEPPVRKERLRALLVPTPETVTWLHPTGDGGFRAERISEKAFQPLESWVDYVVDASAVALEPWMKGATFDFGAIELADGEWIPGTSRAPSAEKKPKDAQSTKTERRAHDTAEPEPVAEPSRKASKKTATKAPSAPLVPLAPERQDAAAEALARAERDFLALDVPADAPERQALWVRMAELQVQLGRAREATLCWTCALWSATGDEATELAERWARAETRNGQAPEQLLTRDTPSEDDVRSLASALVHAARASGGATFSDVPTLQRWLDKHDTALDVRTLWLSRAALDKLAGGDPLSLAKAGDRVQEMLRRGLSLSRDVPLFLRGGTDAALLPRLATHLTTLLDRFERTTRRRSSVEAPTALTQAYVRLVFACGLARVGQPEHARTLVEAATAALSKSDPIHGFLVRAYGARVTQALEGEPLETPLPADIAAELNALATFQRYKVDRLRQGSGLLEPSERLDPARAFGRGTRDLRGEEFAALRDIRDPEVVHHEVHQLVQRATGAKLNAAERQRLIGGLLETLPRLPLARALPLMDSLVAAVDTLPGEVQARLLGDALALAALFGRVDRATTFAGRLRTVLSGLPPDSHAWSAGILEASLRGLRRVGLTREAGDLVEATRGLLTRPKTPVAARLGVASGMAFVGRVREALPVFDAAFEALDALKGTLPERLALMRSLTGALSHAPADLALSGLARLSEVLPMVTDSYNTNSHFCLSVVELADMLVLGHVEVARGSGERARGWLDEDEFLVRRRIHQELEERL
ncbi:hypothetical protein SAMN05443572_109179 [Myxococcus fulvus]|uniref:FtsH ternary system domain-containing protein n=1 Tax=Myxococcus fulvus TaxID=33 RepID=A0A511T5U9_MYXFU|nr:hypothetical protein [Myxococcus fulvus]GEN09525.1 hypothetical protein MFU01_45620 [Myxococcus fulvus]SEU32773.1 hypothetical protein SAMN05443572_109179 [Myxococcus fulvus]